MPKPTQEQRDHAQRSGVILLMAAEALRGADVGDSALRSLRAAESWLTAHEDNPLETMELLAGAASLVGAAFAALTGCPHVAADLDDLADELEPIGHMMRSGHPAATGLVFGPGSV